jgi:hypothetical protein
MNMPRRILAGEIERLKPIVDPEPGMQQQGPFAVQGHKASDLEWRVYRMLHMLGWNDDNLVFQTSILGGRNPGGQVLDFVLYGPGTITVINVNGDHWHAFGQKQDLTKFKESQVAAVMPGARVFSLYSADLATDDIALMKLRTIAGRGM